MYKTFHVVMLTLLLAVAGGAALAQTVDTPVTRSARFTGKINFVTTGGSLRTQSNTGNACTVGTTSSAALAGIPAGTTVLAAYLYWGGSASTSGGAAVVDSSVTLNGTAISATRTFTGTYDNAGALYRYFGGVADVTSRVTGNGTFTFGGLTVNTGAPHCTPQAVLAGWGLVVIYQGSTERLRAINIFDGLQFFRGSALTLTPDGFRVPPTNIDGRVAVITWEGDPGNSDPLDGFSESLRFNGTAVDDGLVPAGSSPTFQQFDGTISSTGSVTSYGVDVDQYNVSALLAPGQESATTLYSAGGDLVMLAAQIVSITTEPKVDLRITKTATAAPFFASQNASYTLRVQNAAGAAVEREDNPIVVTDTLPAGLTYVSATGAGWTCATAGQTVTCTHAPFLDPGQSLPDLVMTVAVSTAAAPSVTNTATVSSLSLEGDAANNASSVTTTVIAPALRVQKSSEVLADPYNGATLPKRIPGATVRYAVTITNSGTGAVDNASLVLTDPLPAGTALFVSTTSGPPVEFVDGSPVSGLGFNYPAAVSFSNQPGGGAPYGYVPVPDANGVDVNVTGLRVAPTGALAAAGPGGNPSFTIRFRVRVR